METFAVDAAGLLFIVIAFVMPARSALRAPARNAAMQHEPGARLRVYRRANVSKIVLSVVAAVIYVANGHKAYGLGFVWRDPVVTGAVVVGLAIYVPLLLILHNRRLNDPAVRARMRAAFAANALLPHTPEERRAWIGVSIVAGVTEEFLYRGFVLLYLHTRFPHTNWAVLVIISSVLFGLAHVAQGKKGVAGTTLAGFLLAIVAISAGLLAAMVLHTLIDLNVLRVLKKLDATADDPPPEPGAASEINVATRRGTRLVAAVVGVAALILLMTSLHPQQKLAHYASSAPIAARLGCGTLTRGCIFEDTDVAIETFPTHAALTAALPAPRNCSNVSIVIEAWVVGDNWLVRTATGVEGSLSYATARQIAQATRGKVRPQICLSLTERG
jgi:membrane protease YdiL (CAAX protease family)